MRTNKALLITMMLGLSAGSTAAYAQALDVNTNADVSVDTGTAGASMNADVTTDESTQAPATSPLIVTENDAAVAPTMDAHPSITTLATAEELVGTRVYDENEELVGEISAVLPASQTNAEERLVIDVGGFLGIGEKPVAIMASAMTPMMDDDGELDYVTVAYTTEELEAMPEVEM